MNLMKLQRLSGAGEVEALVAKQHESTKDREIVSLLSDRREQLIMIDSTKQQQGIYEMNADAVSVSGGTFLLLRSAGRSA